LIEAFEQSASTFASRPAIVTETWQPIYEALNHCANRLAHALVGRGGNPGDRVAVLMNHDAPMLAATLAGSSGIPAMSVEAFALETLPGSIRQVCSSLWDARTIGSRCVATGSI
jgi:non-ribosomal peptide synthetase component F